MSPPLNLQTTGLEEDEMQHSQSLRNKVIERSLAGGMSQDAIAEEFGVSRSSIQNWLRQHRQSGGYSLASKEKSPQSWSRAQRLQALLETHALGEEERGAWCRHAVAEELGDIGGPAGSRSRGFLVHSVLLVDAQSERTVGLIEQQRWGSVRRGLQPSPGAPTPSVSASSGSTLRSI
jgi:transposase